MNYTELAQKVRQKYPGSYDDFDDKTLAQKIVAKYPEYSDTTFDESSAIPQQPVPKMTMGGYLKNIGSDIVNIPKNIGNAYQNLKKGYEEENAYYRSQPDEMKRAGIDLLKASTVGTVKLAWDALKGIHRGYNQIFYHPIETFQKLNRDAYEHPVYETVKTLTLGKPLAPTALKIGNRAVEVAKSIPAKTQEIAGDTAGRIINSLIKPLQKDFKYGKNPGDIAKEGIIARNFEDYHKQVASRIKQVGSDMGKVASNPNIKPITINQQELLKPIDEAIEEAGKQNNESMVARLSKKRQAITHEMAVGTNPETGKQFIYPKSERNFSNLTGNQALDLKREIGDLAEWTGKPSEDKLVNNAVQRVYGKMMEVTNKAIPGIENLNERYANLQAANVAMKHRDLILSRQNILGLPGKLGLGAGAMYTLLHGGSPEGIIAGLAAAGAEKALASTPVKTTAATLLGKYSQIGRKPPSVSKILELTRPKPSTALVPFAGGRPSMPEYNPQINLPQQQNLILKELEFKKNQPVNIGRLLEELSNRAKESPESIAESVKPIRSMNIGKFLEEFNRKKSTESRKFKKRFFGK